MLEGHCDEQDEIKGKQNATPDYVANALDNVIGIVNVSFEILSYIGDHDDSKA